MVPTDEKKRTAIDLSPRQENIELDWIYVQQFVLVKEQGNVIFILVRWCIFYAFDC